MADVIDPLGGSYLVESLTDRIEAIAEEEFARIEGWGNGSMLEGVLAGIERGELQQAIAESAWQEQERYASGDLAKVGVTTLVERDEPPIAVLEIPPEVEPEQVARVRGVRARRDAAAAKRAIDDLLAATRTDANMVPPLIACARAGCTEGEIVEALTGVFGSFTETPRF
ncbi:MAG TPA: methylmalonyl-CoA mutase family protein [Actinomycetota bacterium]|nr:methylmalonyl-CoA mutase family protein [Actinomycetota bacterium]